MMFARGLHKQFILWYTWQIPFLVDVLPDSIVPFLLKPLLIALVDYSWQEGAWKYHSYPFWAVHLVILAFLMFNKRHHLFEDEEVKSKETSIDNLNNVEN
jgi:hypothetical protein